MDVGYIYDIKMIVNLMMLLLVLNALETITPVCSICHAWDELVSPDSHLFPVHLAVEMPKVGWVIGVILQEFWEGAIILPSGGGYGNQKPDDWKKWDCASVIGNV